MDPAMIIFWGTIALKLGPELYKQMVALIGPAIPTWEDLAKDNDELQALIDAEKQ